ncbi:uncharacterized protein BDZ83DRAFT_657455 [Colletotrichum acutatum]|uniref:Uncharacterized protein n=1 Tax=Glomerella acutata TaxID=27357 RepID=A0AAD8XBZ5_GLOAC|nr:uncharacterized protein BDZ83DRAFT_657455 [Colletotrichum acutatum]KAK1708693.1 hypothetical protein BDZ83DRAFT_657455 [Colletotrichum acutatum]
MDPFNKLPAELRVKVGGLHYLRRSFESRREVKASEAEGNAVEEGEVKKNSEDGPGMYQMLHSRIIPNYDTLTTMYEQRAWVFLDDTGFYPSPSPNAKPHFPTGDQALDECFETIQKDEDYWDHPWQARARRRSQKWHNEMSPRKTKPEDYQDSELEENCQISLPDIVDGMYWDNLRPFWQ